ncbi:four helix bundle protein [Gemmatimonadetes bacterium T265]|nr:four helix bundle protein [Gemmatimonadetes bacterium T265]
MHSAAMSSTISVRPARLPRLRAQVEATTLAKLVYDATAHFPATERASIGDQMRRAALSVPSNIAEGCARTTRADRARLLTIAWGSLRELEAQIDVVAAVSLVPPASADELVKHCRWTGRLLHALLHSPMR